MSDESSMVTTPERVSPDVEIMEPLRSPDEHMYRQVPAGKIKLGRVRSDAWAPMPKDKGRLSCDRSSKADARQAYEAFVARGYSSVGSWSVTVAECAALGLPCFWNPNPKQDDGTRIKNEAHSVVDFSNIKTPSQVRTIGVRLNAIANQRGCQYHPPSSAEILRPPIDGTNDNGA